jgi:hypothetical protein
MARAKKESEGTKETNSRKEKKTVIQKKKRNTSCNE